MSDILADIRANLSRRQDGRASLKDLLSSMGDRSFGLLLLLLAIPSLLPVPGLVSLFGTGTFLLGGQMLIGRRMPWLPRPLRRMEFRQRHLSRLLDRLEPYWRRLLPLAHPRAGWLAIGRGEHLVGLFIMVMAAIIIVPLPLTNELPALSLILLALALLQRDGLLVLAAYLFGALSAALMTLIYWGMALALFRAAEAVL
jgi:hypothetical protein